MEHVSAARTRFRREGCGVFFGINDDRTGEQTNNRAELLAVISAMQVHDWNLKMR